MTVCEKLFIQGYTRSRLLRTDLAVVPGNGLIGSEVNANRTQLQNKVFIYVNIIPLSLLAEQALRCQVLSNTVQGDSPILLIVILT